MTDDNHTILVKDLREWLYSFPEVCRPGIPAMALNSFIAERAFPLAAAPTPSEPFKLDREQLQALSIITKLGLWGELVAHVEFLVNQNRSPSKPTNSRSAAQGSGPCICRDFEGEATSWECPVHPRPADQPAAAGEPPVTSEMHRKYWQRYDEPQPPAGRVDGVESLAMEICEDLMSQNMLDVSCVDAAKVAKHAIAAHFGPAIDALERIALVLDEPCDKGCDRIARQALSHIPL